MGMFKSLKDIIDYIDAGMRTDVVRHNDGAHDLESDFVYIPGFITAGLPASMTAKGFRNGVILGNVSFAKYPMSHPLSTETSKGGADAVNWGTGYGAESQIRKCAWAYIDQDEAKTACEAMSSSNSAASTTTGVGGANYLVDTAWASKLVGKHLEVVVGAVTYYRRIVDIEQHNDKIIFSPALPGGVTVGNGDAYTIKRFGLWDLYDWATVKYITAMRYAVNAMPYPKGNNNYGIDLNDSGLQNFGMPDPDEDDGSHAYCKVLTGTGPSSWFHNGRPNGIWGINGNIWEWTWCKMGATVDRQISAGFMAQGYGMPATSNYIATLADAEGGNGSGVNDLALPKTVAAGSDADFDNCYYSQAIGLRGFLVGGGWDGGAGAGVFGLRAGYAPSDRRTSIGFRASL
jgi:hypothetical protein